MRTLDAPATGKTVWKLDTEHTHIEFAVKHLLLSTTKGRFTQFDGRISGSLDDPTSARVEVTIDAASIDTGNEKRDEHLRNVDFLDVPEYPTITYTSTKVEQVDHNVYRVTGDLTIRGITRPIELEASVNGVTKTAFGQEAVAITATGLLSRAEWGVKWNSPVDKGGIVIGNTLRVTVEMEAVKQIPAARVA